PVRVPHPLSPPALTGGRGEEVRGRRKEAMSATALLSDRRITLARGFTLWLTGLLGAGKSTLATALGRELARHGIPVETLDGDEVRQNLSKGLGFSREDRDANIRRIGYV